MENFEELAKNQPNMITELGLHRKIPGKSFSYIANWLSSDWDEAYLTRQQSSIGACERDSPEVSLRFWKTKPRLRKIPGFPKREEDIILETCCSETRSDDILHRIYYGDVPQPETVHKPRHSDFPEIEIYRIK